MDRRVLLIFLAVILAFIVYKVVVNPSNIVLIVTYCFFVSVILIIYYTLSKSPSKFSEVLISEILKELNPDEFGVYYPTFLPCVVMRKSDCFILITEYRLYRYIYICKGSEDYARLKDRIRFAFNMFARKTRRVEIPNTVKAFEGEIVVPHPSDRSKVVRGFGFKILCWISYVCNVICFCPIGI